MNFIVFIALKMIILHTLDGYAVTINPRQVTTLHVKENDRTRLIADDVKCVVGFVDGKFVSVVESCEIVRLMIEGAN